MRCSAVMGQGAVAGKGVAERFWFVEAFEGVTFLSGGEKMFEFFGAGLTEHQIMQGETCAGAVFAVAEAAGFFQANVMEVVFGDAGFELLVELATAVLPAILFAANLDGDL